MVHLKYAPDNQQKPLLESGLKISVSHVDANWKTRWNEGAGEAVFAWKYSAQYGDFTPSFVHISSEARVDNKAAQLWVNAVRSRLQGRIAAGADRHGIRLTFVDRDNTKEIIREADHENAGIVEESRPSRGQVKILSVDAKIFGNVDVDVKLETGLRKTIQNIYGGFHYWPCGWHAWGGVGFGDRQKIRRIITINSSFKMVDGKTGETWAQHQNATQPIDTAKPSVFYGSSKNPIDLKQPDEQIVLAFLEQEVDRFVAKMLPEETSVDVTVIASKHGDCEKGVRALAAGDFAGAKTAFEASIRDHADDHQACFGAGVACEAAGDLRGAAEYYRRAIECMAGKPATGYHEALDRVSRKTDSPSLQK